MYEVVRDAAGYRVTPINYTWDEGGCAFTAGPDVASFYFSDVRAQGFVRKVKAAVGAQSTKPAPEEAEAASGTLVR